MLPISMLPASVGVSSPEYLPDGVFRIEAFFAPLKDAVNDLKLRVSVGQTGSEAGVGMFGYLSGYNFNKGGAVLDGKYVIGVQPGGMPVTDLSWEKNTTYDAGVDMKFLDNRLSFSFDIFKKVISGRPAARYDILLPSESRVFSSQ